MPRRIAAEARWIEGRGFVAHDPATGKPIPTYDTLTIGSNAAARDGLVNDVLESAKTWKTGISGPAREERANVDKAAVIPCFVTVPE